MEILSPQINRKMRKAERSYNKKIGEFLRAALGTRWERVTISWAVSPEMLSARLIDLRIDGKRASQRVWHALARRGVPVTKWAEAKRSFWPEIDARDRLEARLAACVKANGWTIRSKAPAYLAHVLPLLLGAVDDDALWAEAARRWRGLRVRDRKAFLDRMEKVITGGNR